MHSNSTHEARPLKHTAEDVFAQIDKMKVKMHRYITGFGIDPPDDVIQAVAIATVRAESFNVSMEAFIIACMKKIVSKECKKREARLDRPSIDEPFTSSQGRKFYSQCQVEKKIEEEALMLRYAQAIEIIDRELKPLQAKILKMYYLERVQLKDIALSLGTTATRVRTTKRRALQKLRTIMAASVA